MGSWPMTRAPRNYCNYKEQEHDWVGAKSHLPLAAGRPERGASEFLSSTMKAMVMPASQDTANFCPHATLCSCVLGSECTAAPAAIPLIARDYANLRLAWRAAHLWHLFVLAWNTCLRGESISVHWTKTQGWKSTSQQQTTIWSSCHLLPLMNR